jgi:hypothetical protein
MTKSEQSRADALKVKVRADPIRSLAKIMRFCEEDKGWTVPQLRTYGICPVCQEARPLNGKRLALHGQIYQGTCPGSGKRAVPGLRGE